MIDRSIYLNLILTPVINRNSYCSTNVIYVIIEILFVCSLIMMITLSQLCLYHPVQKRLPRVIEQEPCFVPLEDLVWNFCSRRSSVGFFFEFLSTLLFEVISIICALSSRITCFDTLEDLLGFFVHNRSLYRA